MELGPGSFPIALSGKRLEYFLVVFCDQGLRVTFSCVRAVEKTEKLLGSRKSHPCQFPHSSAEGMLRTSHLRCSSQVQAGPGTAVLMRDTECCAIAAWDGGTSAQALRVSKVIP